MRGAAANAVGGGVRGGDGTLFARLASARLSSSSRTTSGWPFCEAKKSPVMPSCAGHVCIGVGHKGERGKGEPRWCAGARGLGDGGMGCGRKGRGDAGT